MNAVLGVVALCAALAPAQSPAKPASGQKKVQSAAKRSGATAARAKSRRTNWRNRQQVIDRARAHEIQEALIREGYLQGPADGVWGDASKSAMERYQADNGWQTRIVPDSRALIKLGLGPDYANALNSEALALNGTTPGGGAAAGDGAEQ